MKTIPIADILIAPNRQRKTFDPAKLHEFAEGIQTRGLFHPIILRKEADTFTLVCGERRLRAVTDIYALGGRFTHDSKRVPDQQIPYTLLTDLDPIAVEEAELEENVHREDLTWQERASACARIAALRKAQSVRDGTPTPVVADIALEIRGSAEGIHHETTRREMLVARHLDKPEVAAAKSLDEAFKILRTQETKAKHKAQGERVGKTFTSAAHKVFNTDSLAWMQQCPDAQFDVILTDPPYGMNADEFGNSGDAVGNQQAHVYADSADLYERILSVCETELFRLAKPQAHLYWFCDLDKFHDTRARFQAAGWWVFRTPLVFLKRTALRAPWPQHGPQRKYELILYAVKGKRPTLKTAGDLLDFTPDSNLDHSAQKPVALYTELLSRSILPGESVLDPFMGTGTILPAAHALKACATGIELDSAYYGIALSRLAKLEESPL